MEMHKKYVTVLLLTVFSLLARAQQSESSVISAVENNSPELKAARALLDAQIGETRTGNSLPDPEVGYNHMWGTSVAAGESDEFTASQGFDFPTAYIHRSKAAKSKAAGYRAQYDARRMETVLRAKLLIREIAYLQAQVSLQRQRYDDAMHAAKLAVKRAEAGQITSIEENKIRMQTISAENALQRSRMALKTARIQLSVLSGGFFPQDGTVTPDPLPQLPSLEAALQRAMEQDPSLTASRADITTALSEKKLATSMALPKFNAGYKYSNSDGLKFNGVTAGMSIPIFQSRGTVKLARARMAESESNMENIRTAVTADIAAKHAQATALEEMEKAYGKDTATGERAELLKKALDAGQISILEYFVELETVYRNMEEYNEISYDYSVLNIQLNKYDF
ncbi:MAG: TolC family protein [Flavobacteriales bacterium]|nr:TolC family protein [Flavobacteriales bacterium]